MYQRKIRYCARCNKELEEKRSQRGQLQYPKYCKDCLPIIRRENTYGKENYWKGKKHSKAHNCAQSAGMKNAWKDPNKFKKMRNQSSELVEKRIKKLRGRPLSQSHRNAISKAQEGKKLSAEHREKCAETWLSGPQNLTKTQQEKRNKAVSVQRTGTHGYGRAKRDNPKHFNAKRWHIKNPMNKSFIFDNLQMWCRANEWRFIDQRPESKLPLWRRAVGGFGGMNRMDKTPLRSWYGWVLVSVCDIER